MVAAPQYATVTLYNKGGLTKAIDTYLSDVANANGNFDSGQGASSTSDDEYVIPFGGHIIDFSINTGMTDTTKIEVLVNNTPTGDFLRYANHLNTLTSRIPLRIPVTAGQRIRFIQRA